MIDLDVFRILVSAVIAAVMSTTPYICFQISAFCYNHTLICSIVLAA